MEQLQQLKTRIEALLEKVPTHKVDIALAVLITLLGIGVYSFVEIGKNTAAGFGFLHNIELRALDSRFKMRGPRPHDDRIVIVDIDETTLQRVGAWPIPRDAYAKMIDKLSEDGARVVALDVAFPTPEKNSAVEAMKRLEAQLGGAATPAVIEKIRAIQSSSDNDLKLADSMKRASNVVLGHLFLDEQRAQSQDAKAAQDYFLVISARPFPQTQTVGGKVTPVDAFLRAGGRVGYGVESNIRLLAESARSYGFFNNDPDADGTMRHALLVQFYKDPTAEDNSGNFYPSLPLEALRVFEDIKDGATIEYVNKNGLERMEAGPYAWTTLPDGTALINYAGPYGSYQHYSMAEVIAGSTPSGSFRDKIVFVGATALGIGDLRNTPFVAVNKPYMGVEIHANVMDNILHSAESGRGFLQHGSTQELIDVALIVILGLGLGWVFARVKPTNATFAAIGALTVFSVVNYLAFAKFGMWLNFVIPAGTLVADYGAITTFRMIFEEREKRKIRKMFSSYVSPGVIQLIEKDPKRYFKTGGEMKDLTTMFSDIRSFTTIAEGLTPDELVHLLNEYLSEMTDILFQRWGTLDKYIGDAIMGFWGSPYPHEDHAARACSCALDMSARLDALNLKWEAQGRKQLSVGIGLNTGPVNVGNMGSDKRMAWTVMGDNVNLASRLEGQTKDYHVRIIVGEGTYLEAKDGFVFRDLDKIRVKGKLKPVSIYELRGHSSDAAQHAAFLAKWNEAMAAYRRGWWSDAKNKFEAIAHAHPQDGPAQEFLLRCAKKISDEIPEMEWDGVYVAKSK